MQPLYESWRTAKELTNINLTKPQNPEQSLDHADDHLKVVEADEGGSVLPPPEEDIAVLPPTTTTTTESSLLQVYFYDE